MLDRCLPLDGVTHIVVHFVIDQQLEPVTLGEAGNQTFAMLVGTTG
jgi:hypothetical protein